MSDLDVRIPQERYESYVAANISATSRYLDTSLELHAYLVM